MKNRSVIFLTYFFILNLAIGQDFEPGFIVTQDYDSIEGLIQRNTDRSLEKICVFKKSAESVAVNYNPEQVISYGFRNGRLYISNELGIEINSLNPTFIRVIVDGEVPLYSYKGEYSFRAPSKTLYTLLKEDDFYKKTISLRLDQCSNLKSELSKLKLSEKSLSNYFYKYHKCLRKRATVYLDRQQNYSLDVFAGGGIIAIKTNTDNVSLTDFSNHTSRNNHLNFGLRLNFASNNKLKIATSLSYLTSDFLIDFTDENAAFETRFQYSSIRLGVLGRYRLYTINEKLGLDIMVGPGISFSSTKDGERLVDSINDNTVFTSSRQIGTSRIQPFGSAALLIGYSQGSKTFFIEVNQTIAFGKVIEDEILKENSMINTTSILAGIGVPIYRR